MNETRKQIYEILGLKVGKEYTIFNPNCNVNGKITVTNEKCSLSWYCPMERKYKECHAAGIDTLLQFEYKEIKQEYTTEEIMKLSPLEIRSCVSGIEYLRTENYNESYYYQNKFNNGLTTAELLGKWTIEMN